MDILKITYFGRFFKKGALAERGTLGDSVKRRGGNAVILIFAEWGAGMVNSTGMSIFAGNKYRPSMKQADDSRAALCLQFLRDIAVHNNREWFHEHREEYDAARAAFESMVAELIARITVFDPAVQYLGVGDCTYRFYRDTRFSPDKSPYKRHFGAYINAKGKKAFQGGYYFHLEPENCMLAGGSYCLPSDVLRAVRQSVCEQPEEFHAIVGSEPFHTLFPVIGETHVKTVPKGFPKDFPYPEYIRCKDYSCFHPVPESFFTSADWLERSAEVFQVMKPFLDFVNAAIDEAV